jgi:hypothetical protein
MNASVSVCFLNISINRNESKVLLAASLYVRKEDDMYPLLLGKALRG